jgi:hypothetical protein
MRARSKPSLHERFAKTDERHSRNGPEKTPELRTGLPRARIGQRCIAGTDCQRGAGRKLTSGPITRASRALLHG